MEDSDVEFNVTSDMPFKGAGGDTHFNTGTNKVDIRLGVNEKSIATMAHEFRHGYGYMVGEMLGGDGVDPLYDLVDEAVAYRTERLFSNQKFQVDQVADGYWETEKPLKALATSPSLYTHLSGRTEQLTLNTAAATYMKYNPDDRISHQIKNNANTVSGAIDKINASDTRYGGKPTYYYGKLLQNR